MSMPDITENSVTVTTSRAKRSLQPKLEAARKLSTESRDSGASSNQSPDQLTMASTFGQPNAMIFSCDSGLGTPSSLMDHDEAVERAGSEGSNASSNGSKWKSSVSGQISKRNSFQS
jgi:hypothetical protein